MSPRLAEHAVRGGLRWVLRLPIWLYRARLGWLLGDRFLMLNHIGRKSGLPRQTVLEVVRHDAATDAYVVAAAWGEKSHWFCNIQKISEVVVHVQGRRFEATAVRLSVEEGERELFDYARRHPMAFGELTGLLMGERLKGAEEDCRRLAQMIPLVAFRPREAKG